MFKFLIRRIKYLFANKTLRGIRFLISSAILLLLAFFIMGGGINQRELFVRTATFLYDSAETLASKIKSGDTPVVITDQGIYIKDKEIGNRMDLNLGDPEDNEKDKKDKGNVGIEEGKNKDKSEEKKSKK